MANWENLSASGAAALQRAKLGRFVAEFLYPFSPHYGPLIQKRRVNPHRVRGMRAIGPLGRVSARPGLSGEGVFLPTASEMEISPTLERVRAAAPFSFKKERLWKRLALGAAEADSDLEIEYKTIRRLYAPDSSKEGRVGWTRYDMDLFGGIVGERLFSVLDAPKSGPAVALIDEPRGVAETVLEMGAGVYGVRIEIVNCGFFPSIAGIFSILERTRPATLFCSGALAHALMRESRNHSYDWSGLELLALDARDAGAEILEFVEGFRSRGDLRFREQRFFPLEEGKCLLADCPGGPKCGLHLYADAGIVELLEVREGKPVPASGPGEIHFTTIEGRGAAFVRARTGWIAEGVEDRNACPGCRRRLPRLMGALSPADREEGWLRIHNEWFSRDGLLEAVSEALPEGSAAGVVVGKFEGVAFSRDQIGLKIEAEAGLRESIAARLPLDVFRRFGWTPSWIRFEAPGALSGGRTLEDRRPGALV